MADGITIPLTGSGDSTAEVATDDCGAAGHAQILKLAVSADGDASRIGADANGLDVDVVRVVDGADEALGSTADASSANTVIGRLKKLLSVLPAGLGQTTKSASLPVTLASDEDAFDVQGSVTVTGTMPCSPDSASVYAGATALTPKFAFANIAASTTDGAVVAAVTSKKIRVLQLAVLTGATGTNITFNSKPGGAGSAKTCLFANGANGGEVLPFSPIGWFETASGEGLSATTGAGSTTGILVGYVEV